MRTLLSLLIFTPTLAAAPPTLTSLYPSGGQHGKTVEITAGGTFDPWPVQAWASAKGIDVQPAKTKGKFTVSITSDVPPGTYWLRLHNADGASDQRPFFVGSLPELLDTEPNDDPKKPQLLPSGNVVVNGRLNPANDVDHFAVELKKGQTLVASLEANATLRSPMDGVLQVVSADGFVLAENHDLHGLDPQLAYVVPRDGKYLVRIFAFPAVPDSGIKFSGAETYIYRLTLTTGGFADHAFPLAVSWQQPGFVELRGWNIPDDAKKIALKPDGSTDRFLVRHPLVANPAIIRVEPHPCVAEVEPNDRSRPQKVETPVTVSGRIDPPRDIDVFEFPAKKGQTFSLQVEARPLDSALDPVARITDAAGKVLSESADGRTIADPQMNFTAPADGSFRIEVRDRYSHGGERFFYRLRLTPPPTDYSLSVTADKFVLTESLEIPVTITRVGGHKQPLELKAVDLPDGIETEPVKADGSAKAAKLKLTAKPGAVSGAIRIVGMSPGVADSERAARATLAAFNTFSESIFVTVKAPKK